jgi:hypothetical protein
LRKECTDIGIALCRHPPCGRTQEIAPNEEHRENAKPLGRNELISNYILRNTGYVRDRKQVSSHIQVIKPFVLKEAISKSCLEDG